LFWGVLGLSSRMPHRSASAIGLTRKGIVFMNEMANLFQ